MLKIKIISKGFTIMELLVVISIIGLLSSIVLTSLSSARAKSRDSKVISEFNQIQKALILYYYKYNRYPNETPVVTNPWTDNFNSMAQQLVTEGFLSSVPVAPTGHTYNYYNYGGSIGGLLVSSLETMIPTTSAVPPSCRPFVGNWCSTDYTSTYYCICNPYF